MFSITLKFAKDIVSALLNAVGRGALSLVPRSLPLHYLPAKVIGFLILTPLLFAIMNSI